MLANRYNTSSGFWRRNIVSHFLTFTRCLRWIGLVQPEARRYRLASHHWNATNLTTQNVEHTRSAPGEEERGALPRSQHAVAITARAQVTDSGNTSSLNCCLALFWFSRNGSGISRGCGVADPVRRRWMSIHRKTAAGFGVTEQLLLMESKL